MKLPAHIDPNDQSDDATVQRIQHFLGMYNLNPRGFRQQGKKSKATRIENLGQSVG